MRFISARTLVCRRPRYITVAIAAFCFTIFVFVAAIKVISFISAATCDTERERTLRRSLGVGSLNGKRLYSKKCGYIINQQNICSTNSVAVEYLFIVFSAPERTKNRDAIRETWGRELTFSKGTRLVFLLGKTNASRLQAYVLNESSKHQDIIQGNFIEAYRNKPLKAIMLLQWTTAYCPEIRFVIKMDDDTVLNPPNFFKVMRTQSEDTIYGNLDECRRISRDRRNKYYLAEEEYPGVFLPPYITGGMYIIGGRVLNLLLQYTGRVKYFWHENIYLTGMVAESAGVARVHLDGMHPLQLDSVCDYKKAIFGHHVPANQISDIWLMMKRTVFRCYRILYHVHLCFCDKTTVTDSRTHVDFFW